VRDIKLVSVEFQPSLHTAASLAAKRSFCSLSAYIRKAVAREVEADGFDPHEARPAASAAADRQLSA
jgi:hypothetical protein